MGPFLFLSRVLISLDFLDIINIKRSESVLALSTGLTTHRANQNESIRYVEAGWSMKCK